MTLLHALIRESVRHRLAVLFGTLAFALAGVWGVSRARFDAFPDLTNVQVQVLTASPGMAAEEVELLVTVPIERELGGVPGVDELRSLSRTGISAVTVVFDDGTDLWHARQLVSERLSAARDVIPEQAGAPAMGPPTTGLGEVFQFIVRSDRHSMGELYRIFEQQIAPRLVTVDGIVEVNAWGGGSPQLDVAVDPYALAVRGLTAADVAGSVEQAIALTAGGALVDGAEQALVRATANPATPEDLRALLVRSGDGRPPVRLGELATISESRALTVGIGSVSGEGEAIFAMAQLLAGADALSAAGELKARAAEISGSLPEGVELLTVYDREKLVRSTLETVTHSLVEGGLLVVVVLLLALGDLRAGLLVASVIPLSMLGAFLGLSLLGYSGNLMSLGAIDFGLIVDGTIVITESIVALHLTRPGGLARAVVQRASSVAGPVLFSVGILILVYIPILTMGGVEGKLFRPMALTVLLALSTALVLSFTYIPAAAALLLRPSGDHQTRLVAWISARYTPLLEQALRHPGRATAASAALLAFSAATAAMMGTEFVPQLQEGDIVVQTARLPSISAGQALEEASRIEVLLESFQEVERVASRTGAPALATDPMGLEESDILVQLRPRGEWESGRTQGELVEAMAVLLEQADLGAELTFTQPIEMRFNELLEGITADVGVKVFGPDLDTLLRLSAEIGAALEEIPGAADVTPPTMAGLPGWDIELRPQRMALAGVHADAVLPLIAGIQRGTALGEVRRGQFRDPVVLKTAWDPSVPLADLPVSTDGAPVPLSSLADIARVESPAIIEREGGSRRFVVQANVRGRDLGGFVREAQAHIDAAVPLPDGYWLQWSGKYEQLRAAASRASITVPAVLLLILGVLYAAFRDTRTALLIFLNVPIAASGGLLALAARGLPISMSAVVGLIALFGIAVMNGIVLLSRTRQLHIGGASAAEAARESATERLRPVIMTAAVAGIGFLPMAIQQGIGAEVQRPLATVVIGGLMTSTLLTLVVLPALYAWLSPPLPEPSRHADVDS